MRDIALSVRSYRELQVWHKGIELVTKVYGLTIKFPKSENYGLTSQIQRSAVSVPSNIAEGQARQHTGEFRQFLYVALGSLAELDTQIEIAKLLNYLSDDDWHSCQNQIIELRKMLHGLINKLPKK